MSDKNAKQVELSGRTEVRPLSCLRDDTYEANYSLLYFKMSDSKE